MDLRSLGIKGAWVANSPIWEDARGSFREWFKCADILAATGLDFSVAQANLSQSMRGVVRGIHFSLAPVGQAKWITCISGSIRDVIVDIRQESATYGQYESIDLVGGDGQAVLIGKGLGHGFVSQMDGSTVAYLVNSPFSPSDEFEINPLDPTLGIDWGLAVSDLLMSSKDRMAPTLVECQLKGNLPSE